MKESLVLVNQALAATRTRESLLDELAWKRDVEESFFRDGASILPQVQYDVPREDLETGISALVETQRSIEGEGPIHEWLQAVLGSAIDRNRLLLAIGTSAFGTLSREIYGSAKTAVFGRPNVDLANHLLERLRMHGSDEARETADAPMTSEEFVDWLQNRIARKRPSIDIEVLLDPECTSKAIAGSKRVRVRTGTTFTSWEAEGLYRHEIETHAFSAQNGAAQEHAPFLKAGGPRSTETQEGLAVFAELYHHALAVPRLRRLALRVKLVEKAEEGASFIDVYRYLLDEGEAPRDAFLDVARVFRGGQPEGGAAFTKDASYLSGLLRVYAFLSVFVRGGFQDECEMLFAGRMHLDDITAAVMLRNMGILGRPRYRPRWLREWGTLLPYFSFASFLDGVDLAPVEAHYAEVMKAALQLA